MKPQISQALNALTKKPNVLGGFGQACIHQPAKCYYFLILQMCSPSQIIKQV